jgi:hypothetical protein
MDVVGDLLRVVRSEYDDARRRGIMDETRTGFAGFWRRLQASRCGRAVLPEACSPMVRDEVTPVLNAVITSSWISLSSGSPCPGSPSHPLQCAGLSRFSLSPGFHPGNVSIR